MWRTTLALPRALTHMHSGGSAASRTVAAITGSAGIIAPASVLPISLTASSAACASSGVRWMGSKAAGGGGKDGGGKKRNTFGSNAFRKKRAAERQKRFGIDVQMNDMPIQAVSASQWSEHSADRAASSGGGGRPSRWGGGGPGGFGGGDRDRRANGDSSRRPDRRDRGVQWGGGEGDQDADWQRAMDKTEPAVPRGGRKERQARERDERLQQGLAFDPRSRDRNPIPDDSLPLGFSQPSSAAAAAASVHVPPLSAAMCCGCGAAFQSSFLDAPGFLPPDQLDKFIERRSAVWQSKQEQEALRAAQAQSEAQKSQAAKQRALTGDSENADADNPSAASSAAADSSGRPAAPANPPPTWSSLLHPHLARQAKLDPSRPLPEQDLSIALNYGLVDEAELVSSGGIPAELIITKRELNALEKVEKAALREKRGEGTSLRCLRCFQLSNYGYTKGQVSSIRAEDFRTLLRNRFLERGGRSCVILKVVDLFDFHGSFIRDFSEIVGGRNPVILVANKFDLLPKGVGENRLRAWIKAEATKYGLHFHSIEIVSAATGHNLFQLTRTAMELAEPDTLTDRPRRDIYIVGTTNVGKSSIVNKLIEKKLITSKGQFQATRIRTEETTTDGAQPDGAPKYLSASSFLPSAPIAAASDPSSPASSVAATADPETFNVLGGKMTASIIPGTTLGMVAFPFVQSYSAQHREDRERDGAARKPAPKQTTTQHVLYDTPGVINPEQLSSILTYHELRDVMPKRQVQPLGFRLEKGQCLLLGGLARLDFVGGDRDYVFATVFASRNVTVHVTSIEKMDTLAPRRSEETTTTTETKDGEAEAAAAAAGATVVDAEKKEDVAQDSAVAAAAALAASVAAAARAPAPAYSRPVLESGYVDFVRRHAGKLIFPPFSADRALEIGLHTGTRVLFDFHGRGWMDAAEDVVFPGLGWVSLTGSGQMQVAAVLPGRTKAYAREPLMPFESRHSLKKFSGSAIRQH